MKNPNPDKLHTPVSDISGFVKHPNTMYYVKVKRYSLNAEVSFSGNCGCCSPCSPSTGLHEDMIKEREECIVFNEVSLKYIIQNRFLDGLYYDRKRRIFLFETDRIPYETMFKDLIYKTLNGKRHREYEEIDQRDVVSARDLALECMCRQIFVEQYRAGVITEKECQSNSDSRLAEIVQKRRSRRKSS